MIERFIHKFINKETISYLFFGVCTTLINIISYKVCTLLGLDYRVSTAVAWILAVAFAYVTNKFFVFDSKITEFKALFKEMIAFVSCRILSGVFEMGFMIVSVEFIKMDDFIAKIIVNVFVVILNYVASKLVIFQKDREEIK